MTKGYKSMVGIASLHNGKLFHDEEITWDPIPKIGTQHRVPCEDGLPNSQVFPNIVSFTLKQLETYGCVVIFWLALWLMMHLC